VSAEHLTLSASTVKELESPLTSVFLIGTAAAEIHHDAAQAHKVHKLSGAQTGEPAADAAAQAGGKQVAS
jgi:hypothetical protein